MHLIKKQSKDETIGFDNLEIHNTRHLDDFLTTGQILEYKPLLKNIRVSQNCGDRRLIDQVLATIENVLD